MPLKVCILGDSVAKGVVLDDTRGRYIYAKESAARLFEQDAGAKVDNPGLLRLYGNQRGRNAEKM